MWSRPQPTPSRRASLLGAQLRAGATAALALIALSAQACDDVGPDPEPAREAPPPATRAAAPETTAAVAAPPAPMSLVYDFARHLSRAELRRGPTLFVDLGTSAGAKYTMGGFRTQLGADRLVGDATTVLVPGVTGQLLLPAEDAGAHTLWIRARAFGDGRLTLYVNDEVVGHGRLPHDTFGTVRVDLPAGALTVGENYLRLRVPSTGSIPGGGRASLAIDSMVLGPAAAANAAAPELASPRVDAGRLTLPDGARLGYATEVPDGARLRARVVGRGHLTLRALEDGVAPRELGAVDATDQGAALDVDLGALAAHVVRLDLVSRGRLTLHDAGIYVPRTRPMAARPPAPKNVLVYLIDTLRADRLRPYAPDTQVRTPGLDRFARTASVFERAHAQENWTKPSVATLLSGLFPWQHRATSGEAVVPRGVRMVSEELHDRGFYTGAFICNGYVSGMFGFRRGWSTWRNYIKEGRRTQARFVAADVLDWLDHRPDDKPFFLYVHTIDPHVPYIPPDSVLSTYDSDPYAGPVNFVRDRELLEKIKVGRVTLNERDKRRLEALYDAEITYHDVHMAAILDGLERRELADDTLVVITADHGEEFYDHGSVGHGHTLYEELLHVPLLIRWPGLEGGEARLSAPAGLVDVLPTLFDVLGLPSPDGLPGRSLARELRGGSGDAPAVEISGFLDGHRAAVSGRFKFIQRAASHLSLFDLAVDPGEQHDLASERPLTMRWLRGLLGLMIHGESLPARASEAQQRTRIDPETEAQLRALGYVGTSAP